MPILSAIHPAAALPGGEIELEGSGLGQITGEISGVSALVTLARPGRAMLRVPEGVLPGQVVVLDRDGTRSNGLAISIGVPLAENLNPVTNPVVDQHGSLYTTLSGARGQQTPVSVFRIGPSADGVIHELRPFAREIMNASGLAFGPDGDLYVSSRAEGTVYRVTPSGRVLTYAEGLGIATGLAFDAEGNLYVGDRSGTIFKIRPGTLGREPETFVFATLEPSIAFYHLAFNSAGVLYVTGPTPSSNQVIHAIEREGTATVFARGLGRAQGMAFDGEDNLYVVASRGGDRGVVRITPTGETRLVVAAANLVGLCLLPARRAALATREAVYEVSLG